MRTKEKSLVIVGFALALLIGALKRMNANARISVLALGLALLPACKGSDLSRTEALEILQRDGHRIPGYGAIIENIWLSDVNFVRKNANAAPWERKLAALEVLEAEGIVRRRPFMYLPSKRYASDSTVYTVTSNRPERVAQIYYHFEIVPSPDAAPVQGSWGDRTREGADIILARRQFVEVTGIQQGERKATVIARTSMEYSPLFATIRRATGEAILANDPERLIALRTNRGVRDRSECQFALYDDGWRLERCDGLVPKADAPPLSFNPAQYPPAPTSIPKG